MDQAEERVAKYGKPEAVPAIIDAAQEAERRSANQSKRVRPRVQATRKAITRGLFNQSFTPEDLILYALAVLVFGFIGLFFWTAQNRDEALLLGSDSIQVLDSWSPSAQDNIALVAVKAQKALADRRYSQAAKMVMVNSKRRNIAFLVGTLVSLMGCIIVIRRVRSIPIEAHLAASDTMKAKVHTTSPGVFIVFMGTLIILSTILYNPPFEVKDDGIGVPIQQTVDGASGALDGNPSVLDEAEKRKILDALKAKDEGR